MLAFIYPNECVNNNEEEKRSANPPIKIPKPPKPVETPKPDRTN
jgi:hypothetical protein